MSAIRTVLSFPVGGARFNYRVAAVVVHNGHVLVCREDDDDYVMLPGGRVEMGEASALALGREIIEEIDRPWPVGRLLFTSESFYRREEQDFHELGLFYLVAPDGLPDRFGDGPWLVRHDEGVELQFSWLPIAGDALKAARLLPAWLPGHLGALPPVPVHVVYDERESGHG